MREHRPTSEAQRQHGHEPHKPWLVVDSFDELMAHEAEIVARIARLPNGGNLFMANPLMLLDDLGVKLTSRAREELVQRVPELSALSPTPYLALKSSIEPQTIHFIVHGLFQRRSP
jgi:hypothetical protein